MEFDTIRLARHEKVSQYNRRRHFARTRFLMKLFKTSTGCGKIKNNALQ